MPSHIHFSAALAPVSHFSVGYEAEEKSNGVLFMSPLKPQQLHVAGRGAWCFINAACHWISVTLQGSGLGPHESEPQPL